MEIWKKVVGYEGLYEISSFGNVKSVERIDSRGLRRGGFIMKPSTNCKSGYLDIYLCKNGKKKRLKIHTLVILAFKGNPKPGEVCRHLDGNQLNNTPDNLQWGTSKENADDRAAHGKTARGELNGGGGKLTEKQAIEIRERFNLGESGASLGREFNITKGMVYHIKNNKVWQERVGV